MFVGWVGSFVRSCVSVREHVSGPDTLKTVGDSRSVTMEHL